MGGDDRAELEAARAELRMLRGLVGQTPALIAYWGRDLRCRYASASYLQWFGRRPDEIVGMHMSELLGPLFASNWPHVQAVLAGAPQQFDREIPDPSGGPARYSHAHYTPDVVDGEVAGFFVLVTDITAHHRAEAEARASAAQIRAVFEAVHDGIYFIDPRGVVIDANRGACAQLGRTRAEVVGLPVAAISVRPEPQLRATLAELRSAGFVAYETAHRRADGSTFPVELVLSTLGPDADAVVVGVARDITVRRQVEVELRRSEHRYRALVENLPGMVAILLDRDLRIVLVDGQAMAPGFTKAGLEGKLLHEALPAEFVALVEPNIRAALAGRAYAIELPFGDDLTYRYEYCPLRDEHGAIEMVLILAKDISERTKAAAAIAASEQRFRTLSAASPVGVFYADPQGACVYANARWSAITGRSDADALGDDWVAALAPADAARWREFVAGGDDLVLEAPFRFTERTPRWIKLRAARVRDAAGATLGLIGTVDDLTERRQDALELEQKNDELTRFTYTVSHDLRSPLVTIRSFAGFLAADLAAGDQARVAQDLGFIQTAAERMSKLLDELLALSRVGRMVTAPTPVPLRALLDEAVAIVQGRIVATGARVEITAPPVIVSGDRVRLVEVFQNLLDNAVKFAAPGAQPHVELGADLAGPEPVLFVRDHGIGIDPRYQHKLFGLFEKLDPAAEGTGVGLALCKRIVELHGGRIWVESDGLGRGTTFRLALPGTRAEGR
jgi:PAS domain S-box-containing protein